MTTTFRRRSARLQAEAPGAEEAAVTGGMLTIDLGRLQENWRTLSRLAHPAECGATVKADAYGLGIEPCARALWQAGCRTFFVAVPGEGAELRRILPQAAIYVLDGLLPGLAPYYRDHGLRPVLGSREEIEEWADGSRLPAALQIDTGLNRLGLSAADVKALAASPLLATLNLSLVISHLACGDDAGSSMNLRQIEAFLELKRLLPAVPASLANSPALFLSEDCRFELARPGIAVFGGNPLLGRTNPMAPVVALTAALLQVRDVAEGESVGYGAAWTAQRPSRVGILAAGYHDGFRRSLAEGRAGVYIGDRFAPVAGRVSMDLMAVDLTDVPPGVALRGAPVELIGEHVTVDDVARWAGTIPYEILTGLGARHARRYVRSLSRKDAV